MTCFAQRFSFASYGHQTFGGKRAFFERVLHMHRPLSGDAAAARRRAYPTLQSSRQTTLGDEGEGDGVPVGALVAATDEFLFSSYTP